MTTSPVMHWLAHGIPLTLLCDLASTHDPMSSAIYLDEASSAELTAAGVATAPDTAATSVAIAG